MAESKTRKKTKSVTTESNSASQDNLPNPAWFAPVMFGFMLLGLAWIITYYVSGAQLPLGSIFSGTAFDLGSWNIAIGFGIAMIGFIMSTRWK